MRDLLKRLSPVWRRGSIPAWIAFGWTMLAHGSTAQFTLSVIQPISHWLDQHAWAGFLMGLCLLALAVLWPGLKSHLPGRRQTDHERLDNIEAERIPMRLHALEEESQHIAGISATIAGIDQYTKTLGILSDNHGTKLENLLHRITALENSQVASEQAFRALPLFVRGCIEIEGLARNKFALYQKFANSTPEERHKDLDAHLQRLYVAVRNYRALDKIRNSATKLQVYVTALRSGEAPLDDQDEAFRDIQKFLDQAISDHAANFVASTPASSTTS